MKSAWRRCCGRRSVAVSDDALLALRLLGGNLSDGLARVGAGNEGELQGGFRSARPF